MMNSVERHILVKLAEADGYLDLDKFPISRRPESVSEAWVIALNAEIAINCINSILERMGAETELQREIRLRKELLDAE